MLSKGYIELVRKKTAAAQKPPKRTRKAKNEEQEIACSHSDVNGSKDDVQIPNIDLNKPETVYARDKFKQRTETEIKQNKIEPNSDTAKNKDNQTFYNKSNDNIRTNRDESTRKGDKDYGSKKDLISKFKNWFKQLVQIFIVFFFLLHFGGLNKTRLFSLKISRFVEVLSSFHQL